MASYLLQEDGLSKFALEDGSGFLILDALATTVIPRPIAPIMAARRRRRRHCWWIPFLLTSLL